MARALGDNAVEKTQNVIDNLIGAVSDNAKMLRIVEAFARHNEAELLEWLKGEGRSEDLAELTNAEKATNFLTIMKRAGKAVLRKAAEDNARPDAMDQVIAAGATAEGDMV